MTTHEAEASLGMWEEELKRLKQVTNVRTLNKEIMAAQSVPAVRIRAYKNGEGSRYEPTLVIGSSIDSVSMNLAWSHDTRRSELILIPAQSLP